MPAEWIAIGGQPNTPDADGWCAVIDPSGIQGEHKEWLIYGPWTPADTTITNPAIEFSEKSLNWSTTWSYGYRHEIYLVKSGNYIDIKSLPDPIAVHTPENHDELGADWSTVNIALSDTIVPTDTIWLAFRFLGLEDDNNFDTWYVDNVSWLSGNYYAYFPGDANMAFAEWPPALTGADVTYLSNYFRGWITNQGCKLGGYYCGGDVNGDCELKGSDVTKLTRYFSAGDSLSYCPDYQPLWLTRFDFPQFEPVGWPNCQ